jgi:hypothetical protein
VLLYLWEDNNLTLPTPRGEHVNSQKGEDEVEKRIAILGDAIPPEATEVEITSVSPGRKGAQITVAFRTEKRRESRTLHLRKRGGKYLDVHGRAWKI